MNYHNLTYPDQNNGDGLRVVLWLSGCPHHCFNCQNPQTWDENSGIEFDIEAKKELFDELSKDYISGITFSGGDPLHENNIIEVNNIIQEIKKQFPNAKKAAIIIMLTIALRWDIPKAINLWWI